MVYSTKRKLDRRNSIMKAVRKELKANNAYVAPELLKALAESLDTTKFYGIEVIRNVEEAAERLRLVDRSTQHYCAGGDGVQEKGQVICGEVTFGENYFYEYFDNGDSTGSTEYKTDPEFDTNSPFVVIIDCNDYDNWEGDCCNHDDNYTTIVVYTPESILDETEYVSKKDAELAELCQLREPKYNLPNALVSEVDKVRQEVDMMLA